LVHNAYKLTLKGESMRKAVNGKFKEPATTGWADAQRRFAPRGGRPTAERPAASERIVADLSGICTNHRGNGLLPFVGDDDDDFDYVFVETEITF
jgi:hypothetical protein